MKKLTFSLFLLATVALAGSSAYAQDDFTQGTDYYLLFLDQESVNQIPAANIKKDYRTDDVTHFLYVWESTYVAGTPSGPNYNGVVGEYVSFNVTSVGWSGAGFAGVAPGKDFTEITGDYTAHFAVRSSTPSASHLFIFAGADGVEAKVAVGPVPFTDAGTTYEPIANLNSDGSWKLIEIPFSDLFAKGLRYPETNFTGNAFAWLSGGTTGTNIQIDAVFFYKKGTAGLGNVNVPKLDVVVTNKTLSVVGATQAIELYNITGSRIKSSTEAIMSIEDVQSGIYIVRSGNSVAKVQIR